MKLAIEKSGCSPQSALNLFSELYAIKYQEVFYLLVKICIKKYYHFEEKYVYKILSGEYIQKYTRLQQNFRNIAIKYDENPFVMIDDCRIESFEIFKKFKCDSIYQCGRYDLKEITKDQEDLLEKIPSTPQGLFLNNLRNISSHEDLPFTDTVRVSTESLKELFNFTLSTKNKNFVSYMGCILEITAGREDRWYLRMCTKEALDIM